MRDLERNKVKFYYSTYQDKQPIYETDENGDIVYIDIGGEQVPVEIGTQEATYSNPIEFYANISANKGETENNAFGKSLDYDRVISTHDLTCQIDEFSHLWVDILPTIKEDGLADSQHDYEVKKVAKSLNSMLIAIKKV